MTIYEDLIIPLCQQRFNEIFSCESEFMFISNDIFVVYY